MTNTLNKTIFLNATREQVWDYLTTPEGLAKWFHAPKSPLVEGGKLALYGAESGNKVCWGEVRVARPPEYLEYTFTIKPMGDAVSIVRWTLEAVETGTRLSLVHEGLPQGNEAFGLTLALDNGWDSHFADLRKALHVK